MSIKKEVLDLLPDKRIQINAAASVFIKNSEKLEPGPAGLLVPGEDEHELSQYAVEFKKFPVPRHYVEKALEDLSKAVLQTLEEKGLIR